MTKPTKRKEGGKYKENVGAICGGVVSKTLFDSDPWAYMMAYYIEDKYFEKYRAANEAGNRKKAKEIFRKYARSAI